MTPEIEHIISAAKTAMIGLASIVEDRCGTTRMVMSPLARCDQVTYDEDEKSKIDVAARIKTGQ